MSYSVVWFKRDLRLHDHAALHQALACSPVLCLYIIEPALWAQPDASAQHYAFIKESLRDLAGELKQRGGRLHVRCGDAVAVLNELFELAPFASLHAHEETGNAATYARDRAVGQWCRQRQVRWAELPQFGVVRRLANRDHWLRHWEAHMGAPSHDLPEVNASHFQPAPWAQQALPHAAALGLDVWVPPQRQCGGRQLGKAVLQDFLYNRCRDYRGGISSPLSAPTACSRLSAHLAYGTLSVREVVQATRAQMSRVNASNGFAAKGLAAFLSRLHWHCHFIQKLESEPELEWRNVHRGYDGLREPDWNPAHFEALTQGRTGWPMVDACVAMLHETGTWLFEPWRMPESVQMACGVRVSADAPAGAPDAWPMPVVDLAVATRAAKDRLHSLRSDPQVRAGKAAIVEKHASRKTSGAGPQSARTSRQASRAATTQLSLGFE